LARTLIKKEGLEDEILSDVPDDSPKQWVFVKPDGSFVPFDEEDSVQTHLVMRKNPNNKNSFFVQQYKKPSGVKISIFNQTNESLGFLMNVQNETTLDILRKMIENEGVISPSVPFSFLWDGDPVQEPQLARIGVSKIWNGKDGKYCISVKIKK